MYKPPTPNSSFTSCGLSKSGRVLYCSSDDSSIHSWDLVAKAHSGNLCGHENRFGTERFFAKPRSLFSYTEMIRLAG